MAHQSIQGEVRLRLRRLQVKYASTLVRSGGLSRLTKQKMARPPRPSSQTKRVAARRRWVQVCFLISAAVVVLVLGSGAVTSMVPLRQAKIDLAVRSHSVEMVLPNGLAIDAVSASQVSFGILGLPVENRTFLRSPEVPDGLGPVGRLVGTDSDPLYINALKFDAKSRIRLETNSRDEFIWVHVLEHELGGKISLQNGSRIFESNSPEPIVLQDANRIVPATVDFTIRPNTSIGLLKPDGLATSGIPVVVSDLSFNDEYVQDNELRSLSTILEGKLRMLDVGDRTNTLPRGEQLEMEIISGVVRNLRVEEDGIHSSFTGSVKSLNTGVGDFKINMMPTYLEKLFAIVWFPGAITLIITVAAAILGAGIGISGQRNVP